MAIPKNDIEITLQDFLGLLKSDKSIKEQISDEYINKIDYDTLWKFTDIKENELLSKNIISIEEKNVTNKKRILNINDYIQTLIEYLKRQNYLSVNKFIKKANMSISSTSVYNIIEENEEHLSSSNIIDVIKNGNRKNIKIVDMQKMKDFIEELKK